MKKLMYLLAFLIAAAPLLTSCHYAKGNVQTLVTNDCGATYQVVKVGESVADSPNPCKYYITVPDAPMGGESKFKATFLNKVKADIDLSYVYTIENAIDYFQEAKYLGKKNSDSDDESNSIAKYELAENTIIDKAIMEIARDLTIKQDIVEFNQADFEGELLDNVNDLLKKKGIKISFLSFVPTPSAQTEEAIDVATAMKVYESRGLGELGKQVIAAKAGAGKIIIGQPQTEEKKEK